MANQEMQGIVTRLESALGQEQKNNKNTMIIAGAIVVIVGLYLIWLSVQMGKVLDPEDLAEVAAGAAVDAAPQVSAHVRELVVEGAPNVARAASSAAEDMIPTYRAVLEDEMNPVIDEVCQVVATTAVAKMAESGGSRESSEGEAMQEAADAVVARLDAVLGEAMDTPMEESEQTPRQMIEASLDKLKVVDRGLRRIANGGGDKAERELVFAWINVLQQYGETQDLAAAEEYKEAGEAPSAPSP